MFELNENEKIALLSAARNSIESALGIAKPRSFEPTTSLAEKCGAFVTLKERGELRGCIGRMTGTAPLLETVLAMARSAAFEDPRFPPVSETEWPEVAIEISVLTPLEPCADPAAVQVGRHGLYIVNGYRSGVLLPQVPVEWGWDRDEFLAHTCRKAGLPPDAWRSRDSTLFTFEAIVFGENG